MRNVEHLLESAGWMQMLPERSKDRVVADSFRHEYQSKDYVARRGEPAAYWIGVSDGLLKVSTITAGGRSVMFTAVPGGSWVGEGSVIKREPRRYDLIAMRTSVVVLVPRATFMWLLETSIDFNRHIIDQLNERARQFLTMREVASIVTPAERLAGAISGLFNPDLYPKTGPFLRISQEELGELAGLSRSTANAAIKKLKRLRLVGTEYGGLVVLDLERLRDFAFAPDDRAEER